MATKLDTRQSEHRSALKQITGEDPNKTLKSILPAINAEVTPPFSLSPSNPADLILNVGSNKIQNPETFITKAMSPVNKKFFDFASGTITFPAASGGNITISPGVDNTLTLTSGNFIACLAEIDQNGQLSVKLGSEAASAALAQDAANFPSSSTNKLAIGFVILENVAGTIQNIEGADVYQFQAGGGSGGGSGDGLGIEPASGYQVVWSDNMASGPTDDGFKLDAMTTAEHISDSAMYKCLLDKAPTFTGAGTNITLSAAPSFTAQVNDVIVANGEVRRITAVNTQQDFDVDAAFTTALSATAGMISQAIYSLDLVGYGDAGEKDRVGDLFPDRAIQNVNVQYEDSIADDDSIPNRVDEATMAAVLSNSGLQFAAGYPVSDTFGDIYKRPQGAEAVLDVGLSPNTNEERLFAIFFPNPDNASVTSQANLIDYKISFVKEEDPAIAESGNLDSAYCYSDGAGSSVNVTSIGLVGGKTQVKTTWSYPRGVNVGDTAGALKVIVDGLELPRYVFGVTTDAYYKEIDGNTIEFHTDLSVASVSIEIIRSVGVLDSNNSNSSSIVSIQDSLDDNEFVDLKSGLIDAPFTEIENRSKMVDLSSDLSARMGIQRLDIEEIYKSSDEFGPNGEPVFKMTNDQFNQVRFVGTGWEKGDGTNGGFIITGDGDDFVEIVFYGTGLNLLGVFDSVNKDIRVSVDDGAYGANIITNTISSILTGRNYKPNMVLPIASGLSEGVHTVRIKNQSDSTDLPVTGFEILNENTQIKVNPGSSYRNGKKASLVAQDASDYNSGFESGILGTVGGRVLVYQKVDGSIAKAVNPVGSPAYLGSADHSNEEQFRKYNFREFGANRADDFSTLAGSGSARAFTLDDGTATLLCSSHNVTDSGYGEYLSATVGGAFVVITFVGTGLSVINKRNATAGSNTVYVDGDLKGDLSGTTDGKSDVVEICSGLPYGTHTVKIIGVSGAGIGVSDFIVYQPKTPELPAGCRKISSYNIMADFVADTGSDAENISQGILRKHSTRELTYKGTIDDLGISPSHVGGYRLGANSGLSGNEDVSYTFFGSGIAFISDSSGDRPADVDFILDGLQLTSANFPSVTITATNGVSFNSTTGKANFTTGSGVRNLIVIEGLDLESHTLEVNNNTAGAGNWVIGGFEVITPIYEPSSSLPYDLQSSLSVGSNNLGDARENNLEVYKRPNIGKAEDYANYTTSSTSYVPIPNMQVPFYMNKDGFANIVFFSNFWLSTGNQWWDVSITMDGKEIAHRRGGLWGNSEDVTTIVLDKPISKGFHFFKVFFKTTAGAIAARYERTLTVKEIIGDK